MNSFPSASPIPNISPFRMKHSHPTWSILKPIVFVLATMTIAKGADSDFDGLDDAVETNTGVYVSASDTGTNPNAADTDGDGLNDGIEVKRFALVRGSFTWHEASTHANSAGGHLASITSSTENQSVVGLFGAAEEWMWIGASDETEEGVWKWVTDEAFDFQPLWAANEPDNAGGNQNYLIIGMEAAKKWGDDSASSKKGYVLENEYQTNPTRSDTDGDGVPDGLEVKEKTSPVDATKFNSFSKGLIAYYHLNGDANELSGKSKSGTTSNITYTSDRIGNPESAANFSANSIIEIPSLTLEESSYRPTTYSMWIRLDRMPETGRSFVLIGRIRTWDGENGALTLMNAIGFENEICYFTGGNIIGSGFKPKLNQWYNITFSHTAEGLASFYIDGSLVHSADFAVPQNTDLPFRIGAASILDGIDNNDTYSFQGAIDDVRIYSRPLDSIEIKSLHLNERPKFQVIQGSYTWQEAKADAEARGGRLAVLNTKEKIDHSLSITSNPILKGSYHIGLQDPNLLDQWSWIDGRSLLVSNWSAGEPQNYQGRGETAVAMIPTFSGKWADIRNDDVYDGYILEYQDSTFLTPISHTNGSITGSGEYDSGTPATLTATPNPGYRFTGWTGDASGTENPLTITMDADKTVGATFEKDLTDADADGLSAYDELVVHSTNPALADTDGDGLSDGWELGIGRFSIITGSFTWQQARTDARSKGGDLASFPTEDRWNRAMQNLGANPFEDFTGLWIGASDAAVDGTWTWVNGEAFSFAPWGTGRPSSTTSNTLDFAEVSGGGGAEIGKWYDRSSTTIRDGYLLETGYATSPTAADADSDGLNDGQEQTAGTRPTLADTDGDGLSDGQEVNLTQTNPRLADTDGDGTNDDASDQDGDGLGNLAEISTHGTDPRKADTDGDGLSDGAELSHPGRFFTLVEGSFTQAQAAADAASRRGRLASFPNANDFTRAAGRARKTTQGYLWLGLSDAATEGTWLWSDGNAPAYARWLDGQPDGGTGENHAVLMENSNQWADAVADFIAAGYLFERVGLDPLATDTDGDGLSDGAEVNTHQTNPVLDDSDSDGLTDGAELNTHGSNPKLADTDGDGLSDSAEVVTHGTNPAAKDSDADGFDDLFEINTGFNPKSEVR